METGNKVPDTGAEGRREDLVASLSRAIFMRESQHAARDYEALTKIEEDFRLQGNLQHDLARLLELGNEPRLALMAYEQILANDPAHPMYKQSLRAAGHLSYRLKSFKKCRRYLEKFVESDPPAGEMQDAESILGRLPDGKGVPKRSIVANEPESVPLPQPRLEDSTGVEINLQEMATESNFEDLIAIGNVEDTNGASEPPVAAPPARKKLTFEDTSEGAGGRVPDFERGIELAPLPPTVAGIASPSAPAQDLGTFGSFFGPPDPIQSQSDVQPMLGIDPPSYARDPRDVLGETPPLSIGARDVVRKMGGDGVRDLRPEKHRKAPGDTTGWARDHARHRIEGATGLAARKPNLYERLRSAEFAMLLPVGEKIILDQVVEALRAVEGLSEADARLAVLERKGLLREGLTCDDVVEIWPKVRRLRQRFEFVTIDPAMRPQERSDAHHVDVLKQGLRMNTAQGIVKAKWEEIRLVSCGRLDRQPCVDIYAGDPLVHCRLLQGTMDFNAIGGTAAAAPAPDPADACRDFLEEVQRKAPEAIMSHTARGFLSGKNWRPQKFPEESEYDRYNVCLLYAHMGESVDARSLCDAASSAAAGLPV